MLKIDDSLLQEIGLAGLPAEDKRGLLSHIYETLEMRVGMRLADQMSNEQLDEFEAYFEAKDDAGAFKWLESNFPNYKEIVNEEFEKLKGEVAQTAPQILAASQQNMAAHPLQPSIPSAPQPQQSPMSTAYQQPAAPSPPELQQPPYQAQQPPVPQVAPVAPQWQQPAAGGGQSAPTYQQPAPLPYTQPIQQPQYPPQPQAPVAQPPVQQPWPQQPATPAQPAPNDWQQPQPPTYS